MENNSIGPNDGGIQQHKQGAQIDMGVFYPQQLRHNVHTAGGGAHVVDHAQAKAFDSAANDAGQHGIMGQHDVEHGKKVNKHGADRHAHQRADQKVQAEIPPGDNKQRDIQDDRHYAHRHWDQPVDNHGHAYRTAGNNGIGVHEELETHGVNSAADYNDKILNNSTENIVVLHMRFNAVHKPSKYSSVVHQGKLLFHPILALEQCAGAGQIFDPIAGKICDRAVLYRQGLYQ